MPPAWVGSAGHVPSSAASPVSTLTTPPGTSLVASTSPRVTAGSGRSLELTTTAVLPPASTGASTLTRPSSDDCWGARTATTPLGSGSEKSKYGPATGLAPPSTAASLSVHPAYQTHRSMAASTAARALEPDSPSCASTSAQNW